MSTYDAFISYKHASGGAFAAEFELHLKRYGRSPLTRPRRIFRDEQHIRPGSDIGATINAALTGSDYLILLASPEAADSEWVRQELEFWCGALGRTEKLIIVITAGTVVPKPNGDGIDWRKTNALPAVLRKYINTLPLWVDMTAYAAEPSLRMDDPNYRSAINAIVAACEDVDPNELNGKEWRIRRRSLRLAWAATATTAGLLAIAVLAGFALKSSNDDLTEALSISHSRELAARSELLQLPESLNTAVIAIETGPTLEAGFALLSQMAKHRALRQHISNESGAVEALLETVDGGHLVFIPPGHQSGLLSVVDLATGERKSLHIPEAGRFLGLNRTEDALYALGATGIWQIDAVGDGTRLHRELGANDLRSIAVVSGTSVLTGTSNGKLIEFSANDSAPRMVAEAKGWVWDIVAHKEVVAAAFQAPERSVQVRLKPGTEWKSPLDSAGSTNALAISPNGEYIAAAHESGWLSVWGLPDLELKWRERLPGSGSAVMFEPQGSHIAAGTDAGQVLLFDLEYGDLQDQIQAVNGGVWALRWLGDHLVTAGSDGWIRLWQPIKSGPFSMPMPPADLFSTEGGELYAWSETAIARHTDEGDKEFSHPFGDLAVAAGRVALAYDDTSATAFVLAEDNTVSEVLFPDSPSETHRVRSVALSPDGAFAGVNWWPRDFGEATAMVAVWSPRDGDVLWLENLPRAPRVLALSAAGKIAVGSDTGNLSVYDSVTGERLHGGPVQIDPGPLEELAFGGEDRLCAGALMGRAICATLGATIIPTDHTSLPTGAVQDIEILPNGDIIVVDVDAARWFDPSLQYRGPLVTTGNGAPIVDNVTFDRFRNRLALNMRGGGAVSVSLDLRSWTKEARHRVTPLSEISK